MAGLANTAIAGRGNATTVGGNLTLNSVAAIVLGGVALTGGVGSLIAVVPAGPPSGAVVSVGASPVATLSTGSLELVESVELPVVLLDS